MLFRPFCFVLLKMFVSLWMIIPVVCSVKEDQNGIGIQCVVLRNGCGAVPWASALYLLHIILLTDKLLQVAVVFSLCFNRQRSSKSLVTWKLNHISSSMCIRKEISISALLIHLSDTTETMALFKKLDHYFFLIEGFVCCHHSLLPKNLLQTLSW